MSNLHTLVAAVESATSSAQLVRAVGQLAAAQLEGAIPTLIATLGYNNPGAAVAAVDGLIALGEPAVPALLEQLDQHNYTARAWAIRALAGIGDPRGLVTLLGAATADFAVSVRRAAARGLGTMKWHWFPPELVDVAQEEALDALLFVAQQDDEWVVRYAAVVGLHALAATLVGDAVAWRSQIQTQLSDLITNDTSLAVRARARLAQQLHEVPVPSVAPAPCGATESPLSSTDWGLIMETLYERRGNERLVLSEGDPRRYRELAVAITQPEHLPHQ